MSRVHNFVRVTLTSVTILIGLGGCRKSQPIEGTTPPDEAATQKSRGTVNYAKPALDLPADRLAERVDGAEVKLRGLGCRRLMVWRLTEPLADLELFAFAKEDGATQMLAEQVGTARTADMPGDEGWIGKNVLNFRRGALFVRLVADGPESPAALLAPARAFDRALVEREVVP